MKKVLKQFNRVLSVALAVAMVITMIPQTSMIARAAEVESTSIETEAAEPSEAVNTNEGSAEEDVAPEDDGDPAEEADPQESPDGEQQEEESPADESASEAVDAPEDATPAEEEDTSAEETGDAELEAGVQADGEDGEDIVFADSYAVTVAGIENATIEYVDNCVEDGEIAENTDLKFTVTPAEGYEVTKVHVKVDATDGFDDDVDPEEGVYTVAAAKITGDVTITATVAKKKYKVTFAATGATVKVGGEAVSAPVDVEHGADISFTVEKEEGTKLRAVTMKVGDEDAKPVPEANGTYTISNVTAAVTVTVTASAPENRSVVFAVNNTDKVAVSEVTVADGDDGKVYTKKEALTGSELKIVGKEDGEVSFIVTPAEKYSVEVKSATEGFSLSAPVKVSIEDTEYDMYTVALTDADIEIEVTAELDESKANVVTLEVEGNASAFTIGVDGNDAYPAAVHKAGDKFLFEENAVSFVITAKEKYEIAGIYVNGSEDALEAADGKYALTFGENGLPRETKLKVVVAGKSLEEEKDVIFNNHSDNLSYRVTGGAELKDGTKNVYTIPTTATSVNFTVEAKGNYEPVVTINGAEQDGVAGASRTAKGVTTTEYSYSISPAEFAVEGDVVVEIEDKAITTPVSVTYNPAEVDVAVKVNGKEVALPDDVETQSEGTKKDTWKVTKDSSVIVVVTPKENCEVNAAATVKVGSVTTTPKLKAAGGEITVKATADVDVTVGSKGLYKVALSKDGDDEPLTAAKNVYTVNYDSDYLVEVTQGVNTPVTLSGIEVTDSKKKAADKVVTVAESGKIAGLDTYAGQKLTVTLKSGADSAVVATFTLNVLPKYTAITVKGVKNHELTQALATEAEYPITVKPATVDLTFLEAEVVPETGDSAVPAIEEEDAYVEGGKLFITTAAVKAGAKGKIRLIDTRIENTDDAPEANVIETITVTLKDPALATAAPNAKLVSASNDSLTLELSVPKSVTAPAKGSVWYKIEIAGAPDKTEYVQETFESSVTQAKIKVAEAKEDGSVELGKYDLTVTLVQTSDGKKPADDSANVVCTGTKAKVLKNLATKALSYETKLTLKKGATKLYPQTGSESKAVLIATAQFSAQTTTEYRELDYAECLSEDIDVEVKNGNEVWATVSADAVPNQKVNITVAAVAKEGMVPASATITVEIAPVINEFSIKPVNTRIYKADKKAASVKLTTEAAYQYADTSYPIKSSKVAWEIAEVSNRLKGKVSVKNGTVTVDKNYAVSAKGEEDYFTVKATTVDANGVEHEDTVDFTVEANAADFGDICIIDGNGKVVARSGSVLEAGEITGAEVVVLKKGTPEKAVYSEEDLDKYMVSPEEYTVVSGNKAALAVDENNELTALKAAKNIKLTATATDGSKKSIVLDKLEIKVSEPTGHAIQIMGDEGVVEPKAEGSNEYEISASPNAVLIVELDVLYGADKKPVEGNLHNYKLGVKDAKILLSEGNAYAILMNKAQATITVSDGKIEKGRYTITNKTFTNDTAPSVKVSDNLEAMNGKEQKVRFALSGNYAADITDVKVDVDYADAYKAANLNAYGAFIESAFSNGNVAKIENGSFALDFAGTEIPARSYKLQLTFGKLDDEGNFVPATKSVAATVKAVAVKRSYKPVTAVKMSVNDMAVVSLKGTGTYDEVEFEDALNANINGVSNNFSEYFVVDGTDLKLTAKGAENAATLMSKEGKNDCIGYISYHAYYETGNEDEPGVVAEGIAKVTVTLVGTVGSYAVSAVPMLEGIKTTEAAVTSAKKPVELTAAYAEDIETAVSENGKVTLTFATAPAKGTTNVDLYVLPTSSYYSAGYADAENKAQYVQDKGIKLTAKVVVKEKAKTAGKIRIEKKDLTQTLAANEDAYEVSVPYTKTVSCDIDFAASKTNKEGFKVQGAADSKILISISAADVKDMWETTQTVVVTLSFGEGAKEETFTFKLTLPKKPEGEEPEPEEPFDYTEIIGKIKTEVEKVEIDDESTHATKKDAILDAAKTAFEEGEFTVDFAEDGELTVEAATEEKDGSASCTLVVKAAGKDDAGGTVECKWTWEYKAPVEPDPDEGGEG